MIAQMLIIEHNVHNVTYIMETSQQKLTFSHTSLGNETSIAGVHKMRLFVITHFTILL